MKISQYVDAYIQKSCTWVGVERDRVEWRICILPCIVLRIHRIRYCTGCGHPKRKHLDDKGRCTVHEIGMHGWECVCTRFQK